MAGAPSPHAALLAKHRPDLAPYESLYKHLHANPELSTHEKETAALIASELRKLAADAGVDLDIRTDIGGHGLIAILENGPGPTIMLRADMDALPVKEKTGLEYASVKTMVDTDGVEKSVMHACGHDMHVACALAATATLLSSRALWTGTLISLFQPAEERGSGANAMVASGLYTAHACPTPDVVLGQHVFPFRAGTVHTRAGPTMSAADSFKITIHGRGGHGSMPHRCVDPVVVAAHVVVRLQSIVAREVPPDETAVVTVGALHAGDTENIISDTAALKLDIRSVSELWRGRILESVHKIVRAECEMGRCPREPEIERTRCFPLMVNDGAVVERLEGAFEKYFGGEHKGGMRAQLASEDFGILGSAIGAPYAFWFWGGVDPVVWDEHEKAGTLDEISVNHSPFFAPCVQPTLRTGVDALVVSALTFLGGSDGYLLNGVGGRAVLR